MRKLIYFVVGAATAVVSSLQIKQTVQVYNNDDDGDVRQRLTTTIHVGMRRGTFELIRVTTKRIWRASVEILIINLN